MRVKIWWILLTVCLLGTAYMITEGWALRSVLGFAGCALFWELVQAEHRVRRMTDLDEPRSEWWE